MDSSDHNTEYRKGRHLTAEERNEMAEAVTVAVNELKSTFEENFSDAFKTNTADNVSEFAELFVHESKNFFSLTEKINVRLRIEGHALSEIPHCSIIDSYEFPKPLEFAIAIYAFLFCF